MVVIIWAHRAWTARQSEKEMRWITAQLLLLPGFWLGGLGGGWAGAVLFRSIVIRGFLGWYFLTAASVTGLCVCFPIARFIIGMGMEIGARHVPARRSARRPREKGA